MKTRITALAISLALTFALFASCTPGDGNPDATNSPAANTPDAVETSGELVWTAQSTPIDLGKAAQTYNAASIGDKLYYQAYIPPETDPVTFEPLGNPTIELRCYDFTAKSYSVIYTYDGNDYPQFFISPDERFYTFINKWDETGGSSSELAAIGADGTLGEAFVVPVNNPGDSWYNCAFDGKGNVYLTGSSNEVAIYSYADETGFTPVTKLTPKYGYVNSIITLPDGTAAATGYNNDGKFVITSIDIAAKTWGSDIILESQSYRGEYTRGSGDYSFYFINGYEKFIGYNNTTKAEDLIFDCFDLDVSSGSISAITALEDGTFRGIYSGDYDEMTRTQKYELITFSKQPKPANSKTVLTYATVRLSEEHRDAVLEFNRTNPNYRIKVNAYGEGLQDFSDLTAITQKLNTEIIAGTFPDIIDLTYFPADVYAAKGILADMYEFIDADEEFTRDNLFEPLLKAAEIDGKLYSLPLSATLMTYMGKKSVVGDEPLTFKRFNELMAKYPDAVPVASSTKSSLLEMISLTAADKFIDRVSATCSFDSEEFIGLLELCNSLPAEYQDRGMTQSEEMNGIKSLFIQETVYDFSTIQYYRQKWQDEVVYAGLPDVGNVWISEANVGISAKSENQAGAWEFVRSTMAAQANGVGSTSGFWGFPLTKKAFDRFLEEQTTEQYYTDENGETVIQSKGGRGDGNGEAVEFYAASPEDVAQIMAVLNASTHMLNIDAQVLSILREECGPLFAGQKTAAETAKVIQSRVSIYVAESK
ncbi:MAG: extracellular solute-binding protein [Oscillospiraceae bacterium]|nr:extracellular solute-binding protein [Oscillospiraceae bacterium]